MKTMQQLTPALILFPFVRRSKQQQQINCSVFKPYFWWVAFNIYQFDIWFVAYATRYVVLSATSTERKEQKGQA